MPLFEVNSIISEVIEAESAEEALLQSTAHAQPFMLIKQTVKACWGDPNHPIIVSQSLLTRCQDAELGSD